MALFGGKASLLPTSPNPFVTASGPVWDEGASIPQVPQNPMPKKGGLFGKQSALWKVLGVLGDGITGNPMFTQSYLGQKEDERRSLMMEQQRQAQLEDYAKKQEIEAQYRPAPQPHRWESNDGSLMEIGPDGAPRLIYKDPSPKINWVRADNGDGTFTMVPVGPSGPMGGGGQNPAGPVGKLKPYGGQTATPSGNFRGQ